MLATTAVASFTRPRRSLSLRPSSPSSASRESPGGPLVIRGDRTSGPGSRSRPAPRRDWGKRPSPPPASATRRAGGASGCEGTLRSRPGPPRVPVGRASVRPGPSGARPGRRSTAPRPRAARAARGPSPKSSCRASGAPRGLSGGPGRAGTPGLRRSRGSRAPGRSAAMRPGRGRGS